MKQECPFYVEYLAEPHNPNIFRLTNSEMYHNHKLDKHITTKMNQWFDLDKSNRTSTNPLSNTKFLSNDSLMWKAMTEGKDPDAHPNTDDTYHNRYMNWKREF